MDPLSLSSLGAAGLGYAVKFLFDRASAALDRRAQRRSADASAPEDSSTAEPEDKDAAANEVLGAMRVLEVYRDKDLALEPGDAVLLDTVQRLHAALERLEGAPVDLSALVNAQVEVDQTVDHVSGVLTGADLGTSTPNTSTHVRQQVGTVHEGGSVTGFRAGGAG